MNSVQKITNSFKKMNKWVKYLLAACILVLLFSIFWPRNNYMGVRLLPVSGSSYYQAIFEGLSQEDKDKPTIAFFFAEWCGYCVKAKPEWTKFEEKYGKDINIVRVDCTKDDNEETNNYKKMHNINGYPTIKYLPNGLSSTEGSVDFKENVRTFETFSKFLSENKK